jgi:mRNA-degrading endonuclease HigB of HigAB toxin-antitoxin module
MRLIGRGKIRSIEIEDEEFQAWLRAWASEISCASWNSPADLLSSYPNASSMGGNNFRFKATSCLSLDVRICFERRLACISGLSEEVD